MKSGFFAGMRGMIFNIVTRNIKALQVFGKKGII